MKTLKALSQKSFDSVQTTESQPVAPKESPTVMSKQSPTVATGYSLRFFTAKTLVPTDSSGDLKSQEHPTIKSP